MFKLNIGELNAFVDQENAFIETLSGAIESCHNAVVSLTDNDFIGKAQFACMENFNNWINQCNELLARLIYIQAVLQEAIVSANDIRKKYEALPGTLGGSMTSAGDNTGVVCLYDEKTLSSDAQSIMDNEIKSLLDDILTLLEKTDTLHYSCAVSSKAEIFQADCNAEKNQINDFHTAFDDYVSAVQSFEETVKNGLNMSLEEEFSLGSALEAMEIEFSAVGIGYVKYSESIKIVNKVTGQAIVDGKYLRLSGYHAGESLTSRYLMENLDHYPKAKALYDSGRLLKAGKAVKGVGTVLDVTIAVKDTKEEYDRNPYLPTDKRMNDAGVEAATSLFEIGVTTASAEACVEIGTLICPGVGTAVGMSVSVIVCGLEEQVMQTGDIGVCAGALTAALTGAFTGGSLAKEVAEYVAQTGDINGDGKFLKDDLMERSYTGEEQRYGRSTMEQ